MQLLITIVTSYYFSSVTDYYTATVTKTVGFPSSSADKESACNAGDPSSIPGSGRSPGERIGYPLQCSWASVVAQLVKNPSAVWKTWIRSLGWEDPLEKGKAIHSSILAWRIPWTVRSVGLRRVGHSWATFAFYASYCSGILCFTSCVSF